VQWIVEHLTQLWGKGATWKLDERPQPHEAHYLKLDCSKAMSQLNWKPRTHLDWALQKIVTWNKIYLDNADIRAETLAQIADYHALNM
jgi:CDP-glucose 4,6-dehydratase